MTNPLLSTSPLPYGLPPFEGLAVEHYSEAMAAGIGAHLKEIEDIAGNSEPATFGNTALAIERSGQLLNRAAAAFFTLVSADASPEIRELETDFSPRFSAHQDEVYLNRPALRSFCRH